MEPGRADCGVIHGLLPVRCRRVFGVSVRFGSGAGNQYGAASPGGSPEAKHRVLLAFAAAGTIVLWATAPAFALVPASVDQSHECSATDCNLQNQVLYPVWNSEQGLQASS